MSHQASAWALDARRTGPLSSGARLVLATMADYADPDGHGAYPSNATIAARLDITPDNVRKHRRTLEDSGLITKGDQALVSHYPADKRPTVYNLSIRRDPSEVMPRTTHQERGAATHQDEPERPITGDAQTKNLNHPQDNPPNPPPLALCTTCGQVRRLVADQMCRVCLGASVAVDDEEGIA